MSAVLDLVPVAVVCAGAVFLMLCGELVSAIRIQSTDEEQQ